MSNNVKVEYEPHSDAVLHRFESAQGEDTYFVYGPPPQMVLGASASNFSSAAVSLLDVLQISISKLLISKFSAIPLPKLQ